MDREARKETALQARLAQKERWKQQPGNRYTPAQLKEMLRGPRIRIHPLQIVSRRQVMDVGSQQYTWTSIHLALERLDQFNPDFLPNVVLVGGAACWYYRQGMAECGNPDFPPPPFSLEEEKYWVSKDLDFVADSDEEVSQLLGRACPPMGERIEYGGAILDFVDQGLVVGRREVNQTARKVELAELIFYVADPALLYAEKQALMRAKSRPQDPLHATALGQFIKWELWQALKHPEDMDAKRWLNTAKTVKTANIAFFSADPKTCRLFHQASQATGPESRSIAHWIKHHIPAAKVD